ncbi:MAG: NAD(P)-binding domain-containing protein [Planctomycetota bacterium]
MNPIAAYTRWLHTQWPAGKPEKLPVVQPDGTTNVSGLYVVGDLSGIPLLKLSVNGGVRVARKIAEELKGQTPDDDTLDVAIVGGGTAGFAAAKEAERLGLKYLVFEASEPFATIVNFPKGKPIYKYPTDLELEGEIEFHDKSDVKEGLIEDLREQTVDLPDGRGVKYVVGRVERVDRKGKAFELVLPRKSETPDGVHLNGTGFAAGRERVKAKRVIVAIGRSGNYRKLGVPGEDKAHKVFNRLHDPKDFCGQDVLIVGGGDSALESAIALSQCGGHVTLSYRGEEFTRAKPENVAMVLALAENPEAEASVESASDPRAAATMPDVLEEGPKGTLTLAMGSQLQRIEDDEVELSFKAGEAQTLKNDSVLAMIGREPPLDFFRKSGVHVLGDRGVKWWATLLLVLGIFTFFYQWKKPGTWIPLYEFFADRNWFPHNLGPWLASLSEWFTNPANPLGTLKLSAAGLPDKTGGSPGFWYSLLYCTLIVVFGFRRMKRRKTPYVKVQTWSLMLFQCVPLFVLPYFLLPWIGHLGAYDSGVLKTAADALFPAVDYDPHGREYWRAFGFILAWPLFIWNVFTSQPMWTWLVISLVQTFVLIPLIIRYWGKGAYCGWICSCGAMAETLGDTQRHKMPHGPFWNRFNMVGQAFLALALGILVFRVLGWAGVGWADTAYQSLLSGDRNEERGTWGLPALNYAWFVDLLWAGIIGFGLYFHFSGRVWCRFACPLAALMHVYARFSKFRIFSDKKKCISCNVCTSVCHQGIDIMSFANKGKPMEDPECVRCSACVQMCPTGVLSFGQIDKRTGDVAKIDPAWLAASPVNIAEGEVTVNGKVIHRS